MFKKLALAAMAIFAFTANVHAQDFKGRQRSQEKIIKSAHKKKKITDKEYEKLMHEQQLIKNTMEKYAVDGVFTSHEKNVIHDKLVRAEKRLNRYKTNGEIY